MTTSARPGGAGSPSGVRAADEVLDPHVIPKVIPRGPVEHQTARALDNCRTRIAQIARPAKG